MPNRGAVHIVGLMETSLPQGGGNWQVVHVLAPDRSLIRPKISRMEDLIEVFSGHQTGGTEDARNQRLRPWRESCYVLTGTAQGGQRP